MATSLWNQCLVYLERELSGQDFNTWIRPLQAVEDNGNLRLLAPNQFVLDWVKQHAQSRIETTLTRCQPKLTPTLILQIGSRQQFVQQTKNITTSIANKNAIHVPLNRLNSKLTFTTFVPGKSNQLARAAALQVADQGGYNPLFIYGGVGLGKTHLMQAIGNQIMTKRPQAKVLYLHSEQFVNEMIKALREKKINEFKRFYRSLDALLIDDIQFFANKIQSQEELFHTFNSLLEEQKQIILTGNHPPQTIAGLEDRLKSRFSWGLTVNVTPPDFETRVAILMAKAHYAHIHLPTEVSQFIANHVQSNVRELEGALHRLVATARFMQQTITLESAQTALQDLLYFHRQLVTLNGIQEAVAEYFKISMADLSSRKRHRLITRPRQIAMYLSKELTQHSLPEIGKAFGGRDHTTVMYSCKTIAKLKTADYQLNQDYTNLLHMLST